jgi:hypothetical protein
VVIFGVLLHELSDLSTDSLPINLANYGLAFDFVENGGPAYHPADFLFSYYLLIWVLNHATNRTRQIITNHNKAHHHNNNSTKQIPLCTTSYRIVH